METNSWGKLLDCLVSRSADATQEPQMAGATKLVNVVCVGEYSCILKHLLLDEYMLL